MDKKIAFLILVVLLLVAFAFWFLGFGGSSKVNIGDQTGPSTDPAQNQQQEAEQDVVKTEVDFNKYPDRFPDDIPIEAGGEITQNYNASTKDGVFQATRAFISEATLANSFTTYRRYMNANDWEVQSQVDTANYKMLFATKEGEQLQVEMDQNTVSGIKTITISYSQVPVTETTDITE